MPPVGFYSYSLEEGEHLIAILRITEKDEEERGFYGEIWSPLTPLFDGEHDIQVLKIIQALRNHADIFEARLNLDDELDGLSSP